MEKKNFIIKKKGSGDIRTIEATRTGKEFMSLCPWHNDTKPSLSINEENGVFFCHGCKVSGKVVTDSMKDLNMEAIYNYRDKNDNLLYQVIRYFGKKFKVRRPDSNGGYVWNLDGIPRVLYNLPEIIKEENKLIIIVEGEKDVETLKKLDYVSTCNFGGAGKWKEEYLKWLIGKEIVVIADNDDVGLKHAITVSESLIGKADSVKLIKQLPVGKDITEFIEKGGTQEKLKEIISNAPEYKKEKKKEGKEEKKDVEKPIEDILNEAITKPVCHPAMFSHDGIFYVGVRIPCGTTWIPIWVSSEQKIFDSIHLEEKFTISNCAENRQFEPFAIREFCAGKTINSLQLYQSIYNLFNSHVIFQYNWQPSLLSIWVMATYLHRLFMYFPYLHIHSMTKRCGKSILLEILSSISFNATSVMIGPTEAVLFRTIDEKSATIILDEVENLREYDSEDRKAMFSILNAGFKKGAIVPRVGKGEFKFRIEEFEVYSPKVFAGINNIKGTLRDRSIKIELSRKKSTEKINRFNIRKLNSVLKTIVGDLYIFALTYAKDIEELYEYSDYFPFSEGVDDRSRDILEPLFAVAGVIDATIGENIITSKIREATEVITKVRNEDELETEPIAMAINSLVPLFSDGKEKVILFGWQVSKIFQEAGIHLGYGKEVERNAKSLLNKMGFRSTSHTIRGKSVRGYGIEKSKVMELVARYPVRQGSNLSHSTNSDPSSPSFPNNDAGLHGETTPSLNEEMTDEKNSVTSYFSR